ncbi:fumarylacetoacetate hydrolase family protein [Bacillus thermotolerans]|uniref:fumarylacetoacetate hydrolase family protein n=1 Tax=Bacillus thermotolerans TaxID=1221996 RepID=UPI0005801EF6|nr:fumarylacetoacetate hydrolase family protein [Bacillus thermotolerans]KKB34232.1 5-carboxymethyl-2-oxo-hex-3- ene-1,7-dioate decarboxylase [Bacillus thermotolerans]KKB44381.1 5-carboxymethyl-2-oxo-hex-3- ene-1,7-dioate decarboxylase [Bacillus thermotolerans]
MVKAKRQDKLQPDESNVKVPEEVVERKGDSFQVNELPSDVPVSGTVYGTLLNYQGALEALGEAVHEAPYKAPPQAPILYIKPLNTMNSHKRPIPLPSGEEELEVGASLALIIGRTATRVREEEALEYIAGYTVANDVSIPHDSVYRPAIKQKARDGFCPIGPWITDKEAVSDINQVSIRVYINGQLRQENTTAHWIRPAAQLLADVTEFMTLHKGDVLLTGVPEGAPRVKAGDTVRIEIDGIGILENHVMCEEELTKEGIR